MPASRAAPVGGDADGLEGDYLPVVQAPPGQSQSAQEPCRGSGLRLSRKRWCSAGASSSACASRRKLPFSNPYSAVLVYTRACQPPDTGRPILVVHVPMVS